MALVYRVVPNYQVGFYDELFNYQNGCLTFSTKSHWNFDYSNIENVNSYMDTNEVSKHFFYFIYDAILLAKYTLKYDVLKTDIYGYNQSLENPSLAIVEYDIPNEILKDKIGFGNYSLDNSTFLDDGNLSNIVFGYYPAIEFRLLLSEIKNHTNKLSSDEEKTLDSKIISYLEIDDKLASIIKEKSLQESDYEEFMCNWYTYATKDFVTRRYIIVSKKDLEYGGQYEKFICFNNNISSEKKYRQYLKYVIEYKNILTSLGLDIFLDEEGRVMWDSYNKKKILLSEEYIKRLK